MHPSISAPVFPSLLSKARKGKKVTTFAAFSSNLLMSADKKYFGGTFLAAFSLFCSVLGGPQFRSVAAFPIVLPKQVITYQDNSKKSPITSLFFHHQQQSPEFQQPRHHYPYQHQRFVVSIQYPIHAKSHERSYDTRRAFRRYIHSLRGPGSSWG